MDQVNSTGITGSKANFTIVLPHHSLSFTTKLKGYVQTEKLAEANLPSEASIALPAVHVSAEYIPESASGQKGPDGVIFRQGGYLNAHADIGVFEHSLTTDLLNHLVFVQKVFMKVSSLYLRFRCSVDFVTTGSERGGSKSVRRRTTGTYLARGLGRTV